MDSSPFDVMSHGKRMISINLKTEEGVKLLKKISDSSDVLLDTFRPGVMEKLNLGPADLLKSNSSLIYARLTGYGQNGPYKFKAGHDINYVAISGILSILQKPKEPPAAPANLLADFAGGGLMCAFGIVLALFERMKSGRGQIIDASMTEGAAYVATWLFKSRNLPIWSSVPGTNALDGGLACYCTYETKDGKFMAVGALEPQFYMNFLRGLQLSEDEYIQGENLDRDKNKFKEIFLTKTQDEWCQIFDNLDACVTPVVDFNSVDKNDCNSMRQSFYKNDENLNVPEPAPKLSLTPGKSSGRNSLPQPGEHTVDILKELGYNTENINEFSKNGIIYVCPKSNL